MQILEVTARIMPLMRPGFAFVILLIALALSAVDTIPSIRAKDHIEETATVCGRVADTRRLELARTLRLAPRRRQGLQPRHSSMA